MEFHGATITSDAGLPACRELDDALGLTETADEYLQGVGLSSLRLHPTGGEPGDDEDGQEAWFTARVASLIG
ncbi:MAG: hypothetical protein OXD46_04675 [Chloroflexi bacterium]|nr:hypothetical protein [Chloroflexota bacterium]